MSDFRIKSEHARKHGRDYDDPKTLDEVQDWAEVQYEDVPSVAPPEIGDDEDLWEIVERIAGEFPECTVLFGGGPHYIDTVYVQYGGIDNDAHTEDFREFMTLHFKHWMEGGPEENEGICPLCDDRVEISHETFRDDDDNLWASPDEFDFREYPDYGKVCRMWWD